MNYFNQKVKLLILLSIVYFAFACQKEYSIDKGASNGGKALGSLQDSAGNCQNIVIHGNYAVDSILTDSNYVLVNINITSPGKYLVSTDSANGFWFIDSAFVVATGIQTIKVHGHGKPVLPLTTIKTVSFNNSYCQFTIYFLPPISNTDYFPNTINSNWSYFDSYNNIITTITAINNFKVNPASGLTYQVFASNKTDTFLYRKDGNGNYYEYAYLDDSTNNGVDYKFLEDYATVNTSWSTNEVASLRVGVSSVLMNFTIAAKDTTITYNNIVYSPVIKVKEDLIYKLYNGKTAIVFSDYAYYAKSVGWINTDFITTPPSSFTLQKYTIY